jgi:hypothetical protein
LVSMGICHFLVTRVNRTTARATREKAP